MNISLKLFSLLFTFILVMGPGRHAHAQDIYYSKEERFNFQNGDYSVIGQTGHYIYTYSASNKGYFLNAYNDSMALEAKIALDFFPERVADAQFINYPDQIIVLFQAEMRNYIVQYAALLDDRALLIHKPIAIDSVKSSWFGGSQKYFSVTVSPDKSKIMVYGLGKKDLSATLIDNGLHILHHGRHNISSSGNDNIHQALLDNSGRFYFSIAAEAGNKDYAADFHLYQLSEDGHNLGEKMFPADQQYYSGLYSKINRANGQIYSAGFYSGHKNGNLEGVIYFTYDPGNRNFSNIKRIPFTKEVLNDADTRNKKKAFNDEQVRDLVIKNDGGFLLVSEDAYVSSRTEMTPGWGYYSWYYAPVYPDRTIYEYHYGDVLIMDFDTRGTIQWHRFIRKDQYSQDDNGIFSSYAFLNSGSSLVFLYNDFNNRSSSIKVAAMDAAGQLQLQTLNTGNIGNADWLPRKAVQVDKATWVIPVLNRNNLFFAKVVF
ncbi:MAG TPA: hypothetical protein VFL76_03015 [Edaphocola sp.]|nr:hypothetical protein [Edaphocola sp.]